MAGALSIKGNHETIGPFSGIIVDDSIDVDEIEVVIFVANVVISDVYVVVDVCFVVIGVIPLLLWGKKN